MYAKWHWIKMLLATARFVITTIQRKFLYFFVFFFPKVPRSSVSARLGLGRLHRAGESVRVLFFFNLMLSKWYVWVIYVKLIHPGYLASAFMHILW